MTKLEQLRENEADAQLAADGAQNTYNHALAVWEELVARKVERDPEVEEAGLELKRAGDLWSDRRTALLAAQNAYLDELNNDQQTEFPI